MLAATLPSPDIRFWKLLQRCLVQVALLAIALGEAQADCQGRPLLEGFCNDAFHIILNNP